VFAAPLIALSIEGIRSLLSESPDVPTQLLMYYGTSSVLLVLGSVAGAVLFGVYAAYLCARYTFVGRSIVLWASILPLGVPSYLVAYTWVDFLVDSGVPGGALRNLPVTCLIFSICLSPYVFLPVYTALNGLSASVVESAQLLGRKRAGIFLSIELPLVRAAIFAGALLAGLEVLADFGTVDFMAIDTWSTGIYRQWFGHGDRGKASQLALFLFLLSAVVLFWESGHTAKKNFAFSGRSARRIARDPLSNGKPLLLATLALFPALIGCIIPLIILGVKIASSHSGNELVSTLVQPTLTTLSIAAVAGLLVVLSATLFTIVLRYESNPFVRLLARAGSLGYALPGGVLGLGLLILLAPFSLSGSIIGLLFAYCVRFSTVGTSTLGAGWLAIPKIYEAQAHVLGCNSQQVFIRVTLPLLRKSVACAFILTSIDVIKELPATMLLRPFNFETLAIRTYTLASDERLSETAPSAFAMIILCLLGIAFAAKFGAFSLSEKSDSGHQHD